VTITGPTRVKVNTDVTFSVTVDPPFLQVTSVDWKLGEKAGQGDLFAPSTETTTTKMNLNIEGDYFVTAIVHGTVGQNEFAEADGILAIHNECLANGDVCDVDGEGYTRQSCCAPGLYCPGVVNGTGPYHCVPLDK
jgi:hypothetical protein